MDILALILACSLHPDDALVRTLVDVQSSGNVYFVGDLSNLQTRDGLTSADAALKVAEEIAGKGGRPAVGLLGVPIEWAAHFGRSPRDLFDGCTNIAIGTAALSEYEAACSPSRDEGRQAHHHHSSQSAGLTRRRRKSIAALRSCVLSRLAGALGLKGTPAEILKRVDAGAAGATSEPSQVSPIFAAGVDDAQELVADWSDRRIYLEAGGGVRGSAAPTSSTPLPPRSPAAPAPGPAPAPATSSQPRGLRPIPILRSGLPSAVSAATAPLPPVLSMQRVAPPSPAAGSVPLVDGL
jgi:hypothetical protein